MGTECASTGHPADEEGNSPELGVGESASLQEQVPTSIGCHLASGHVRPPPACTHGDAGPRFLPHAGAVEGALVPGLSSPVLTGGLQGHQWPEVPRGRPQSQTVLFLQEVSHAVTGPGPGVREHHRLDRGVVKHGVVHRAVLVLSVVSVIVAMSARGPGVTETNDF